MLSGIGPAAHLQEMGIDGGARRARASARTTTTTRPRRCTWRPSDTHQLRPVVEGAAARRAALLPVPADPHRARSPATCSRASPSCAPIRALAKPDVQFVFQPAKRLTNPKIPFPLGHGYAISPVALYPKSRGTVRLASPDPLAAPLIDPHLLEEPDDIQPLIRALKIARAAFATRRVREVRRRRSGARARHPERRAVRPATSARPATPCTTRSAPAAWARTPRRWSIPSCAFNGIAGLRIADAASCRRSSAATPTRRA